MEDLQEAVRKMECTNLEDVSARADTRRLSQSMEELQEVSFLDKEADSTAQFSEQVMQGSLI